MVHTSRLWSGSRMDVPVISMSEPLMTALKKASYERRIRYGLDAIIEKLAGEKRGIAHVRKRTGRFYGDRISRLLLLSNDGAERFYRHIEQMILQVHAPRLLCCLLNIDSNALSQACTGKEGVIKAIMAEHKDVASDILRALVAIKNSGDSRSRQL